jgi:hypothetical protein
VPEFGSETRRDAIMSDIPEDIKIAAYDCARGIYLAVDDGGTPYLTEDDIEEIAKTILAERNSHASIIEERDRLREALTDAADKLEALLFLGPAHPLVVKARSALSPPTAEGREL